MRTATAAVIASWASSADEIQQWCSRTDIDADIVASWSAETDVIAYTLARNEELVAYGQLWLEESEVELARLIVAPPWRGRGVGRRLVSELTVEARRHHPAVFVRVHPDNTQALRCYRGIGFGEVSPVEAAEWNHGQPVAYVWLRAGTSQQGKGAGSMSISRIRST